MSDARPRVVLGWHMHQPEYRDPVTGEYRLPWTYLHAIKDYADMAAHLEAVDGARAVVNVAPLLLEQISDYGEQIRAYLAHGHVLRDPVLAALVADPASLDPPHRTRMLDAALQAHPQRLIARHAPYRVLADHAARHLAAGTAGSLPDAFCSDLLTWFHLAWMGETLQRGDALIAMLIAQARAYTTAQRRQLLERIGSIIEGLVPRYAALARAGKVELSTSPYGHPILPLLQDFASAREAWPEVELPAESAYPGGAVRADWHLACALSVFSAYFGQPPAGCWSSEGGLSVDTLRLLAAHGLRWTAGGQSVLSGSAGAGAPADRAYRVDGIAVDCFFRDDALSDAIGFRYATWQAQDAVEDLVRGIEARATRAGPGAVITIFLDGENAWEHFEHNGYDFLRGLYQRLATHPGLRLSTFTEALDDAPARATLPQLRAGSWVYGTFSTWIGSTDKNRAWSLLVQAKRAYDLHAPRLSPAAHERAARQLAVCEGSDWFWWFGDDNPERAVAAFDALYRQHLRRLYELIGVPAPAALDAVISHGRGQPALGGVMKPGQAATATIETDAAIASSPAIDSGRPDAQDTHLRVPQLSQRRAGVLLHPTSLPGPLDTGDVSHDAYRFIEFAAAAGFSVWQMLPVGPTHADHSPYLSLSANAGNPLLISLDWLRDRGWLQDSRMEPCGRDTCFRRAALREAHARFRQQADAHWHLRLTAFQQAQATWLDDDALFMALREAHDGAPWTQWPAALRDRDPAALAAARRDHALAIDRHGFEQFVFFTQWAELRAYAHRHGLSLFGDLPLFVAHDSVDLWAHRHLFAVDAQGRPQRIAGVPPDYFAADGQIWGNPLYRWAAHEAEGFAWWKRRMATQLTLFDLVRIDHFRGLESHWELPADARTAREGRWVPSPGAALIEALDAQFHPLPLVAEDLGVITPEVEALRRGHGLPGMRVLQFAFDGSPHNPHLPQNFEPMTVAYTGTHDNATTLEWFESLDPTEHTAVHFHFPSPGTPMPAPAIHAALSSVARLAMLPMQDLLGLGAGHRMNTPGTATGNWRWRFAWSQVPEGRAAELRLQVERCGRR